MKKFCYARNTLLFLGFYAHIFVASVFSQHSTNEVKKLGAEASSIRFQVGSSDGLSSLKTRWHFCLSGYTWVQIAKCLLGQDKEDALPGRFRG